MQCVVGRFIRHDKPHLSAEDSRISFSGWLGSFISFPLRGIFDTGPWAWDGFCYLTGRLARPGKTQCMALFVRVWVTEANPHALPCVSFCPSLCFFNVTPWRLQTAGVSWKSWGTTTTNEPMAGEHAIHHAGLCHDGRCDISFAPICIVSLDKEGDSFLAFFDLRPDENDAEVDTRQQALRRLRRLRAVCFDDIKLTTEQRYMRHDNKRKR